MAASRLDPQTGVAFCLAKGQPLKVIDLEGEQVADLVAFNRRDHHEWLSSGRSIDYANTVYLTKGNILYSNRSRPMLTIVQDDVGRHDFLLIIYRNPQPHPSCFENLSRHLAPFGINSDAIPTTFNIFMNVEISDDGKLSILPPRSRPGDVLVLQAETDLIVGLTACSAEMSNNYRFKPIGYEIIDVN
jgi:uncharacterized protein